MKLFLLKNKEGQYLNTDYHSRWRNGMWRDRNHARTYRSLRGLREAFNSCTPAVYAFIGLRWVKPEGVWSDADHERNRAIWEAYRAIPLDKYFELIAEDGYVVEEIVV